MPSTPDLAEVIESAIDSYMEHRYTMLPGVVVSYDADTQTATVQCTVKQRYVNEVGDIVAVDLPQIPGAVVLFPGGSEGTRLTFPLQKGAGVAILFSSAALDRWKASGSLLDPGDDRRNALPDAICIPGLYSPAAVPHRKDRLANGAQLHGRDIFIGDQDTGMVYLGDPSATEPVATAKSVGDTLRGLLTDHSVASAFMAYATAPSVTLPAALAALEAALHAHFTTHPVQGALKAKVK